MGLAAEGPPPGVDLRPPSLWALPPRESAPQSVRASPTFPSDRFRTRFPPPCSLPSSAVHSWAERERRSPPGLIPNLYRLSVDEALEKRTSGYEAVEERRRARGKMEGGTTSEGVGTRCCWRYR
jgi:hypothetical protein